MGDYRLEVKIRNARFLRALASIGETPTSFAKANGFHASAVCGIASMKLSPRYKDGMWRSEVMALCDAANVMPSDLFTEKQMLPREKTAISRDVSEAEIGRLASSGVTEMEADPMQAIEARDLLGKMKSCLTTREVVAVDMAANDYTFDEIGSEIGGVTRERARQIVIKAERKMREYARKRLQVTEGDILRMFADD